MKMQVAVIGAGPAGLMLGHLLHNAGIETIVLEIKFRQYIEERVRAGVPEKRTVDAAFECQRTVTRALQTGLRAT